MYVATGTVNAVKRYDGTTGAHLGDFTPPYQGTPVAVTFSPDSAYFFVAELYGQVVMRHDGTTGQLLGTINAGGLSWPADVKFGPDGKLYVTARYSASVKEYDAVTGAYIRDFVSPGSGGLQEVIGLLWVQP